MNRGSPRSNRGTEELVQLALGLGRSGCQQEDLFYQNRLRPLIQRLLIDRREEPLTEALERVYGQHPRSFESLSDLIEAQAMGGESGLLLALPVMAWSRYDIPTTSLSAAQCQQFHDLLTTHVVASGVAIAVADFLYGPDQLPAGFCGAFELASRLQQRLAQGQTVLAIDPLGLPATTRFLADPRYLLALIRAQPGEPLFRWHQPNATREEAVRGWQEAAHPALTALLPSCALEPLLPDAYFPALRHTDEQGRAFTLQACVEQLRSQHGLAPDQIQAVIAPCHDGKLVEYRIGLLRKGHPEVLQGAVWGLLDGEEETTDVLGQIQEELQRAGVTAIQVINERHPLSYCDDCGAPLFPTMDGELSHTVTPEDLQPASTRLH
jgi:hypothetical protein